MKKRNLKSLPWNDIWVNLDINHRSNRSTAAAYVLLHGATGHYYFGATGSLYNHFQVVTSMLKLGKYGNQRLQKLFNRVPKFRVMGVVTNGQGRSMGDARLVAEEIKQLWIAAHQGDPLMLNENQSRHARVKYVSWRHRQVCIQGHVFTNAKEASQVLGLRTDWVKFFCDDPKTVGWQWV